MRFPIFFKLFLAFILLGWTTVGLGGALSYTTLLAQLRTNASLDIIHTVDAIDADIQRLQIDYALHAQKVSNNVRFQQGAEAFFSGAASGRQGMNQMLEQYVDANAGAYYGAAVISQTGEIIASSYEGDVSTNIPVYDDVKLPFSIEEDALLPVGYYRLFDQNRASFIYLQPVYVGDDWIGHMALFIPYEHLEDYIEDSVSVFMQSWESGSLVLVDERGIRLYDEQANFTSDEYIQIAESCPVPSSSISLPGDDVSFIRCVQGAFAVLGSIHQDEVDAAATDILSIMLMTGAIGFIIAVIFAYFLARTLSHPIQDLQSAASRVAKGDLHARAHVKSRDELGDLAMVFNRMVEQIQEMDEAKANFISIASHQLRTPLTSMRLFLELLNDDLKRLSEEERERLHIVETSTLRMIALVRDLLNLSRLEAGKISAGSHVFTLAQIIEEMIEEVQPQATERGITIESKLDQTITLETDEHLLREIIHNFLTNAIRYSPEHAKPIQVWTEQLDGAVRLHVKDHGIGISKDGQEKIFGKFYRSDRAKLVAPDGSGLGMYIAKMMSDIIGAEIGFTSKVGKGTDFYVTIPMQKSDEI